MGDENRLAHTRWNRKFHIVFAPKYRRQVFYAETRRAMRGNAGQVAEAMAIPRTLHEMMLVGMPGSARIVGDPVLLQGYRVKILFIQ